MFKLDSVQDLKKIIKENTQKEEVSRESYIRAKANLKTMFITNTADAFLYFASINLINTYVKSHKDVSYNFKLSVNSGIDGLIANDVENATFCYDAAEKAMMVNIAGLQFSFHNVKPNASMQYLMLNPSDENGKFYKKESWQGVRLQTMAETLFDFANNLDELSNTSLAGNLKEYQKECLTLYSNEDEKE